jgi:hypothetical protein
MKKTKLPNIVAVLILTLITVVMWVSFSIYRAVVSAPSAVVPAAVSQPLTPTLDSEAMTLLESRVFIDESQIPDSVVSQSAAATPAPVATPIPEPSAAPEILPEEGEEEPLTQ